MAILTDLRDPRIEGVTVTYVEVSPDMRQAKVHVSIMGSDSTAEVMPARAAQLGGLFAEQDFRPHRHALHAAAAIRIGRRREEITGDQPDAARIAAGYEFRSPSE